MKTFEEIVTQEPVFLNQWSHKVDVIGDFEDIYLTYEEYIAEDSPYGNAEYWRKKKRKMDDAIKRYEGVHILFASYGADGYSGDAFVLFEKDGKLYEVNGGHCSCHGLEGQWSPDEVMLPELENRLIKGTLGEDDWTGNMFKEELCDFLGVEYVENKERMW